MNEALRVGLLFDRILCDDARIFEQLQGYAVSDFRDHRTCREQTLDRCRSVEVLITGKHTPTLPLELAEDPGALRYICHTRGVVHAYFPRPLVERGILLTNWGDSQHGVAEKALSLLMSLLFQIPQINTRVKTAKAEDHVIWQDFNRTCEGFRIGIYGCGNIGRHMARLCLGLGMQVGIFDPWATAVPEGCQRYDNLDALFAASDGVSIHVGLSDETIASVGKEQLRLLPRGGILVNTARGRVVKEAELAEFVAAGRLCAGVDVIENEKDWVASPLAPHAQCLMTGHGTVRAPRPDDVPPERWYLPAYVLRNLEAYQAGRSLENVIDLARYDRTT